MIGMHEEVGGKLVIIPHESVLEILTPGMERSLSKILIGHHTVEEMYKGIHTRYLSQSPPWVFLTQS